MIYTVTFNPAVDYVIRLDRFNSGEVNRAKDEEFFFGGKGINVSLLLKTLGTESVALGFCAGFTGKAIEDGVRAQGVKTDFVHLSSGNSRINVKIKGDTESEINGQGPEIPEDAVNELINRIDRLCDGDSLVLSGSICATLPQNIYETILRKIEEKKILTVVDACGELLLSTLKYKPFLIKPNISELGEIFAKRPENDEEIIKCAASLKEKGARNVLVSMGRDGSLLADENGNIIKMGICHGSTVSSVGAGDSMVAGFLSEYLDSGDMKKALVLGTACGCATAFSLGLADKATIFTALKELEQKQTVSL